MATSSAIEPGILRAAENARALLLAQRTEAGHWEGELSASALSTATASAALALVGRAASGASAEHVELARRGGRWLAAHANDDGGFGDTTDSPSNLSTTALAWMALDLAGDAQDGAVASARQASAAWLRDAIGELTAPRLAESLAHVYGEDRTFAVPILTACAIGGAFGDDPRAWRSVPGLPFELAALPQILFRWLGLPVVSYALPALIAIGQAIEHHRPTRNPLARLARRATRERTLRVLERIQPENGGFLEATPLTSFVVMALVSCGRQDSAVVRRGVAFLAESVRPDGSWPIDTNLATWVTTLAVNALAAGPEPLSAHVDADGRAALRSWLLGQQYRVVHPYTGAAAGGWAWTDLPGGVPDADDTAGALLALRGLGVDDAGPARAGGRWLAALQNRDGGIPTFCRGWGKLPFDQSSPDLTAHTLRAFAAWEPALPGEITRARTRAADYLVRSQGPDGAWVPLWFGNQAHAEQANPLYGTSRVLRAAACGPALDAAGGVAWSRAMEHGNAWLVAAQASDGGFGGAPGLEPTVEETALGLEALCDGWPGAVFEEERRGRILAAARWLARATDDGRRFEARPIGLYFAKLWYSERLYPLVFTVSALERARAVLAR